MLGKIAAYLQICDSVMISLLLYRACLWCLLPCMSSCSVYKQNVNGMVFCTVQENAFPWCIFTLQSSMVVKSDFLTHYCVLDGGCLSVDCDDNTVSFDPS